MIDTSGLYIFVKMLFDDPILFIGYSTLAGIFSTILVYIWYYLSDKQKKQLENICLGFFFLLNLLVIIFILLLAIYGTFIIVLDLLTQQDSLENLLFRSMLGMLLFFTAYILFKSQFANHSGRNNLR